MSSITGYVTGSGLEHYH